MGKESRKQKTDGNPKKAGSAALTFYPNQPGRLFETKDKRTYGFHPMTGALRRVAPRKAKKA